MKHGTVKRFLDALEEMRTIYPFKDEETMICTVDIVSRHHDALSIKTTDEKTGICIEMTKYFREEG